MKKLFLLLALLIVQTAQAADIRDLVYAGNFPIANFGGSVSFSTMVIDSADDSLAVLYQMPRADTITTACFRYGVRAATPVAHKVSIQGVSATTYGPDGTILGGGSPAEGAFTPPADTTWDGLERCVTLTNSIAVTRGQFVSIVIAPTGTPTGTNKSSFTTVISLGQRNVFPVSVTKSNGGAWSRQDGMPVMWLRSSTTTYGYPLQALSEPAVSSDSTPDEYANTITLPAAACDTFNITGIICHESTIGNANKNFGFHLYTGTTELAATTVDSDRYGAGGDGYRTLTILFDDVVTNLTCGSEYRYSVSSDSTSANFNPMVLQVGTANDLRAYVGGTGQHLSTRSDAGAWTDVTTSLLNCAPIISDITEPSAGGVSVPRKLKGGFQ